MAQTESKPKSYVFAKEEVIEFLDTFVCGPQEADNERIRNLTSTLGEDFVKIQLLDGGRATLQLKPAGWALRRVLKRIK